MKIKYVIGIVVLAFALGVFLPSQCGKSKIAYWKGRSEQATQELKQAEEKFEIAIEADKELQEEKDLHIAELEEEIANEEQRIVVIHKSIVVTRDMLIESGLYQGLVKELDEKWASKYTSLEGVVARKDVQLVEWKEKFDSKVEVAIKAYTDKDLKQKEALRTMERRAVSAERQVKSLSLRGELWKWAAIVGGGYIGYTAAKELL